MNVSACLVTRGDVDMSPILTSLTAVGIDDIVVWGNDVRENLAVYGRYAAIAEAKHDFIYVQDDDVIVSDPLAIVRAHIPEGKMVMHDGPESYVTCNMPEAHRSQPFYREHSLVGFGAVFHRDAPARAFQRYWDSLKTTVEFLPGAVPSRPTTLFERRCDVLFTALTPRVLVDVPIHNLPYYDAPNRSWKQPEHFRERKRMLELALQVRDNG